MSNCHIEVFMFGGGRRKIGVKKLRRVEVTSLVTLRWTRVLDSSRWLPVPDRQLVLRCMVGTWARCSRL